MTAALRPIWTVRDSTLLYNLDGWGSPYFHINPHGHVSVNLASVNFEDGQAAIRDRTGRDCKEDRDRHVDLYELVRELQLSGRQLPLLIHFDDIVADRLRRLAGSFQTAISRMGYPNCYRGLYPVKVNQQRHLVEAVVEFGRDFDFGLEVGSKPELAIALATCQTPGRFVVCNGYKDRSYIEMALLGQRLGHRVAIVLEHFRELELVLAAAADLGIEPLLGVRAKLWERSSGHWSQSVGERAKFGLDTAAILAVVNRLEAAGMLSSLQLLHYHIGSQVAKLETHARAAVEATEIFAQLARLGAPMQYLDVGGGLSVDYDGSRSQTYSSCGYSLADYAATIAETVLRTCNRHNIDAPVLMSESGRASVTHQSVLVFDVVGTKSLVSTPSVEASPASTSVLVRELLCLRDRIPSQSLLADYRQAGDIKQEALLQFGRGELSLADRAEVERLYWSCCQQLLRCLQQMSTDRPEAIGLRELEPMLAQMYCCNFSVFQSLPDSWAIDQIFPVMPIHRLDEQPTVAATIADLTCDSDGNLDRFVGAEGQITSVLPLHTIADGEPYYIGVFLTGSYQEILGDLHNLFGDTNAVHVRWDGEGATVVHSLRQDSVADVMAYVHFEDREAIDRVRQTAERARHNGNITAPEARQIVAQFAAHLHSSTYLQD